MRLGIAIRLAGILVLASLVIVEGGAVKNRAFEGKSEHYTVVLLASSDAKSVAAQYSKQGVKVDHVVTNATTQAYEASMTANQANKIQNDAQVAYIEMDSQKTVHHSWWDTAMITMGLQTPRL